MSLATKYLLAGMLWGLALGYAAVAVATGLGVVVLWLTVYGNGPWGDSTSSVLYALALVALVGSIAVCGALGYRYGRRVQAVADEGIVRSEHRRVHLLAGAALLVIFMGAYQLCAQNSAMETRQASLERAVQARHFVYAMRIHESGNGRGLDIALSARGMRNGRYLLTLSARDGRGQPAALAELEFEADQAEVYRVLPVEYRHLVRTIAGSGSAGLERSLQRYPVTLVARLTPILDRRELRALPRHAADHYQAADSPFHSTYSLEYVLEAYLQDDQYWVMSRDGSARQVAP